MTLTPRPEEIITADAGLKNTLPRDFWFAAATAAYQIEGGWDADGKGASNWDVLMNDNPVFKDIGDGKVACDSYHLWREDVALLKKYGMNSYRFSLAWSRIIPDGGAGDPVNEKGVEYYDNLINGLLAEDITPFVTIFHWDHPYVLEQRYNGFESVDDIVRDFVNYARVCFERFGDRVKHWITINEPLVYTLFNATYMKEGRWTDKEHAAFVRGLVLCHAYTVELYDREFRPKQGGEIGITLNIDLCVPIDDADPAARAAAHASVDHMLGMYADPIYLGFFPRTAIDRFGEEHLTFTGEQWAVVNAAASNFGINHYSTSYATGKWFDYETADKWKRTRGLQERVKERNGEVIGNRGQDGHPYDVPWGFRRLLRHIHNRYTRKLGIPIIVTENGFAVDQEYKMTTEEACHVADVQRQQFYAGYIRELALAVRDDKIPITGYMAWSLLDNIEWATGYVPRFGLTAVDFTSEKRTRTPKDSAFMLRRVFDHLVSREVSKAAE
ncbi:hypothetical protein VHUM_01945 [Vanrija humicola]|uniref:beta-glucosidase n=1 Tax=Vanrija humicola TaxID=5417 RepID=A0A7D8V276_VANHU|nr:hypothetical protein VHUM_01945 [Vanrija humicola]